MPASSIHISFAGCLALLFTLSFGLALALAFAFSLNWTPVGIYLQASVCPCQLPMTYKHQLTSLRMTSYNRRDGSPATRMMLNAPLRSFLTHSTKSRNATLSASAPRAALVGTARLPRQLLCFGLQLVFLNLLFKCLLNTLCSKTLAVLDLSSAAGTSLLSTLFHRVSSPAHCSTRSLRYPSCLS